MLKQFFLLPKIETSFHFSINLIKKFDETFWVLWVRDDYEKEKM